jgi:uncharacterized protein VirK/YbjX
MGSPWPLDKEGEMSLRLLVDGMIVFVLSFAVVPGSAVKSQAAEVLLITQLQGRKGAYHEISFATKSLHAVAPGALLLAAAQGFARAFGIIELAAVRASRQTCYTAECAAAFNSAYDDFFTELGIACTDADFFSSPLPIQDKPLTEVKPGHKLRTKEKRAFKQLVQTTVFEYLAQHIASREAVGKSLPFSLSLKQHPHSHTSSLTQQPAHGSDDSFPEPGSNDPAAVAVAAAAR